MSFSVIRCLPAVFHTLLHRLVVDPLQYSPAIFCSVVLLIFSRLASTGVHFSSVCRFSSVTQLLKLFNRICLILLDITRCVLCLTVSFVILTQFQIQTSIMPPKVDSLSLFIAEPPRTILRLTSVSHEQFCCQDLFRSGDLMAQVILVSRPR